MMMSFFGTSVVAVNENSSANTNVELSGVIKTNSDVDVSNIKVDILSSELKQSEDGVFIYENTYSYSVYTDYMGGYSFKKPSENCLVQIDLKSIPDRTGVDKQSCFVDYTNDLTDFTLDKITDVEISGVNDVTVYNTYRDELVTDLDVEVSPQSISTFDITGSAALTAGVTANANGFVETLNVNISDTQDDLITRADKMYSMGIINDTERMEMYLEAIKTDNYGEIECATSICDELIDYISNGENDDLKEQISYYIDGNNMERDTKYVSYVSEATREVSNSKIKYTLYYESDPNEADYMSESEMNKIQTYVQDIIDFYFIDKGFKTPMLLPDDNSYRIHFTDTLTLSGAHGETQRRETVGTSIPIGSYIRIRYPANPNTANDIKKTIAHEIFHSIQYAYNSQYPFSGNDKWFTEAVATYAGLNYIGTYIPYATTQSSYYLKNVLLPFTNISGNRNYGMFLFPQYLSQNYGGINAIKRTLEYVENGYPVLEAMEKAAQYVNSSVTYGELFAMFQRCNADPRRYINSNGQYSEATRRRDNVGSASNVSVISTASAHYGVKASTTSSSVTLTVNITSGSYSNAMFKLVKFPGDGGPSVYVNYKPTSSSFTIYVNSFKLGTTSTVFPRLTLVASNTSFDYATKYIFGLTRTNK